MTVYWYHLRGGITVKVGAIKDDSKTKPKLELSSHDMKRKQSRDMGYPS